MRVLVVTTKGGSGKSTISQQVVAPWLHDKSKDKVLLVEIDDLNADSETFKHTEVFGSQLVKRAELKKIAEYLVGDHVVVDVGGNVTAEDVVRYLIESELISFFELVIVPVGIGEQDVANARYMCDRLSDRVEPVLALNFARDGVRVEEQYPHVFGYADIESYFKMTPRYVIVPLSELVLMSRVYGLTIYDLGQMDTEPLREKMKEALKAKDGERVRKISERICMIRRAKGYIEYLKKEVWSVFEKEMSDE